MIIIGTLVGLAFIYVLLRVFFPIKNEKVESSKSEDDKNAELDALSIKYYGKPYKEIDKYDAFCLSMYGKPYEELSDEEQKGVGIAWLH